ncbi:ATP-binding protein [Caulobacter sp. ErkDOM-YI]|uniref:ATP-binding protein n=1 Tax=unclassified Caulobacter TaxID=2648921 RepID=UPI003AF587D4
MRSLLPNTEMTSPLARRLLAIVAVLSIAVTGVATAVAFVFVQKSAADTQMRHLAEYVGERVKTENRLFSDLVRVHEAASLALTRRLESRDAADALSEFNTLFPSHGDGTRRTVPALYDGERRGPHFVYGIGGYLKSADQMGNEDKALFVSALEVVANTGETEVNHYDNFYFFTPRTRLVMFGPKRADKLLYYRQDAPPTLDVSGEEMTQISLPEANPGRGMKCTKLRRLISDPTGRGLTAGCMTPFYFKNQFMGIWGTSLSLDSYLLRAVGESLPDGTNMIVTDGGELIAAPGLARKGVIEIARLRELEERSKVADLIRQIKTTGRDIGAIRNATGDQVIAYGRLEEPNWWFLMTFPSNAVVLSSIRTASWVLLFGVLGVMLQVMLLYRVISRELAWPLNLLAQAERGGGREQTLGVEARQDEIGDLARTLRQQREGNEELLRSLEDRVAERTAELERANRAKSVFLANMSHELRTPLNGVIAIGDRLADEENPQVRRELAELVTSSGRLLEQVLGDILDVSKIEAGQFHLNPAPFDLDRLVRGMAELHAAAAQAKGLDFSWSIAPDASGGYLGDSGRINQILSNLLANAVKFTAQGSIVLTVERRDDRLVFTVADTGVGFDDTVRERLFKRFVQADQSITRQFGGTGLGLSISAALAEMMGGSIDARAVVGSGATFSVELPLPPYEGEALDPRRERPDEISLQGLTVLVAEDHPTNRKVVEVVLEPFGVDLTMVEDGAAALAAAKSQTFDAILMDMQMPIMDGLTATREIRAHEVAQGLPPVLIIMVTANAMEEHIASAKAAGADLHLAKPLHPALLLEALAGVRNSLAAATVSAAE